MAKLKLGRGERYQSELRRIVSDCYAAACDADLGVHDWAAMADLHPSTILNLATGETTMPRFQTVVAMARAVGVEFSITSRTVVVSKHRTRRTA